MDFIICQWGFQELDSHKSDLPVEKVRGKDAGGLVNLETSEKGSKNSIQSRKLLPETKQPIE